MNKRLAHFDVVKGVAIFLVVMGHCMVFALPQGSDTALFRIIRSLHMPLFFFVSGWWTARACASAAITARNTWQRALRLLPSALVVSFLWTLAMGTTGVVEHPVSFPELLCMPDKAGYWFPWTLFLVFVSFALLTRLWGNKLWTRILAGLCMWSILTAAARWLPDNVTAILSLHFVRLHFPAFFIGVLAGLHSARFYSLISDSRIMAAAIVLVLITFGAFCAWPEMPSAVYLLVYQACIVPLFVVVFRAVGIWCARPSAAVSLWAYLGRRSYAIYLLHYFFLFPVGALASFALAGFLPSLLFSAVYAAAVIACVLLLDALLRPARPLAFLLCGDRSRFPNIC